MTICKCYKDADGNKAFCEWDKNFHPDVRRLTIIDKHGQTIVRRVYCSEKSAKATMRKFMNNPVQDV